jgi:hypothetical protein
MIGKESAIASVCCWPDVAASAGDHYFLGVEAPENKMTYAIPLSKKTASAIMGVAAILFYLWLLTWAPPVKAAPGYVSHPAGEASQVEPARIYKRGRTPIYPYWYNPPGPRGWSSYFGFVPYSKGEIENQAIDRQFYPQDTWPHSDLAPPPDPYGVYE